MIFIRNQYKCFFYEAVMRRRYFNEIVTQDCEHELFHVRWNFVSGAPGMFWESNQTFQEMRRIKSGLGCQRPQTSGFNLQLATKIVQV